MAKSALLWVGRHMVVKDEGLFDNLPWTWSTSPAAAAAEEASNSADNNIAIQASQAKRDAYDAFFGKDIGIRK